MLFIRATRIASTLDFDYGEGCITFAWLDDDRIERTLTIGIDGYCCREMPIRSGNGVEIVDVQIDRVRLRLTERLAANLELDEDVEFAGDIPENVHADLRQLADCV